ncbi:sugar-transfer associated ATP-grasp domain-containing protein [Halorhodospira halophila]|uniref:sugar-transfer associated ATP-grasp domain-containing protein n=1 Tax=Halorhodospira halophila TaxID=1053 RepID=UPI0016504350|nr:sugar-transfer associated ATP-grasp domain-containing protein [Halorhodospira halophila]
MPRRFFELLYATVIFKNTPDAYLAFNCDLRRRRIRILRPAYFHSVRDSYGQGTCYADTSSRNGQEHAQSLTDKLDFYFKVAEQGVPTAPVIGTLHRGAFVPDGQHAKEPFFKNDPDVLSGEEIIAKPQFGQQGKQIFCIGVRSDYGQPSFDIPNELEMASYDSPFVVQRKIYNHPVLERIHKNSLNTLRIVTGIDGSRNVVPLVAVLRIGARGAITDNARDGRVIIGVDLVGGATRDTGFWIHGFEVTACERHPDSGAVLGGVKIPFWTSVLQVAEAAHRDVFPGVRTIGWDIAISPQGPYLIEGNWDWGCHRAAWVEPEIIGRVRDFAENVVAAEALGESYASV